MSANPIDKLESQLEALIEGAFTRLFRHSISARDIAVLLLRSMEDNANPAGESGTQPVAPDRYRIYLHPQNAGQFLERIPDLAARLAGLITELSAESGFQLYSAPEVLVLKDGQLDTHQARISAEHSPASCAKTEKMDAASDDGTQQPAQNACLHIVGSDAVPLTKSVINIGRGLSNDVVLNDSYVSGHHAQLCKRFGVYTLTDVNSSGGTRVNNIVVSKHRLQNGDVIRIGHTDLVYAEDNLPSSGNGTAQVMPPE
jgi:hypothetical protein